MPTQPHTRMLENHRRLGFRGWIRLHAQCLCWEIEGKITAHIQIHIGSCHVCHLLRGDRCCPCYLPVAWASAACNACSCATCQAWNDAPAGASVSVIETTGIPAARASPTNPFTSLVVFCELKTSTLICLLAICWLIVALSSAVRSSPSAMAFIRLGGV